MMGDSEMELLYCVLKQGRHKQKIQTGLDSQEVYSSFLLKAQKKYCFSYFMTKKDCLFNNKTTEDLLNRKTDPQNVFYGHRKPLELLEELGWLKIYTVKNRR